MRRDVGPEQDGGCASRVRDVDRRVELEQGCSCEATSWEDLHRFDARSLLLLFDDVRVDDQFSTEDCVKVTFD